MQRKNMLQSLANDEEKAKAERLAKAQGLSVSALIRQLILTAPEPQRQQQAA